MKNSSFEKYYPRFLVLVIVSGEILLGLDPKADRSTWVMENLPVWILLPIITWLQPRIRFSKLALTVFAFHALVLMFGGHYTYAKVPWGFTAQEIFHFSRNPYDRLGHIVQGFGPAFAIWEIIVHKRLLHAGFFLSLVVFSMCMAFSAIYELLEWAAAIALNEGAEAFLGTQGDVWDTQWDLFCCLLGAMLALLILNFRDRKLKS